jgi:hypothetical protein
MTYSPFLSVSRIAEVQELAHFETPLARATLQADSPKLQVPKT